MTLHDISAFLLTAKLQFVSLVGFIDHLGNVAFELPDSLSNCIYSAGRNGHSRDRKDSFPYMGLGGYLPGHQYSVTDRSDSGNLY